MKSSEAKPVCNKEGSTTEEPNPTSSDASTSDPEQKDGKPKKKKRRCLKCNKKLGLTAVTCRCGGLFCAIHIYSNEHGCTYDYKQDGAKEISKSNPKVVAEKIKKI